jgi:pimeloyl-ACP methyl ester carboxylesterase
VSNRSEVPIVLVHGAWLGAWCWREVAAGLTNLGHSVTAVQLHRGSLDADIAAVQQAIDLNSQPSLVCGHSYGGAVITGLAPRGIEHAVYLAAAVPDARLDPDEPATPGRVAALDGLVDYVDGDSSCIIKPELRRGLLFHDCSERVSAAAIRQMTPQRTATLRDRPGRTLWSEDVPTTYVVCTEDRMIPQEFQRAMSAGRCDRILELSTAHSPFLSDSGLVTRLLHGVASG